MKRKRAKGGRKGTCTGGKKKEILARNHARERSEEKKKVWQMLGQEKNGMTTARGRKHSKRNESSQPRRKGRAVRSPREEKKTTDKGIKMALKTVERWGGDKKRERIITKAYGVLDVTWDVFDSEA